ncbi:LysR substrate-binding domain-containing protein [Sneathiella sp.]|uniref:LysR substrate-binding domain-containing protein n=1 Tax=Sneathiella sp. TaxID=1964365 RepID=UPI002FE20D35
MLQIPSSSGLRAFEAACRYLSFNQAAEELGVTPGAVSRQIQTLEHYLGKTLFHRHHKRIELTAVGRQYLAEITLPLEKIAAATARLRSETRRNAVSICAYPTFVLRWLIPRWANLYERHPDIDVQLVTSLNPTDFERDDFDLSIQILPEGASLTGMRVDKLLDVLTYPVCSPEMAERFAVPGDLRHAVLLHESPRPTDWARWCAAAGLHDIDTNKGLHFESANMALHAAENGLGVAIGIEALVKDSISGGQLVRLFDVARRSNQPFQIVSSARKADRPKLRAVREWMLEAAGQSV